jgi:phospholipase C
MLRARRKASLQVERLEERRLLAGDIHTIQHIIIIMQENVSFDKYFGTYPGADGFTIVDGMPTGGSIDPNTGQLVAPFHLTADSIPDSPHGFADAEADINGGQMNGFLHGLQPGQPPDAMGYYTQQDVPNYWAYAQNFVLQDHMFTPVLGWSLPTHLYLVSGWSAHSSDPNNPMSSTDDPVQPGGEAAGPHGDKELYAWTDLTYLLHQNGVTWNYFTDPGNTQIDGDPEMTPGIWNPLPAFTDVHQDNQLDNITSTDTFFADAAAGTLPNVSWVLPNGRDSEHPPGLVSNGEAWVTNLVNAVMQGPDWNSTAIFITHDEWGGFYDHVAPPVINGDSFGLRVASVMISPWAKQGYIDHQVLSFDNYLKFIEDDFLNGQRLDPNTDGRPDPRPVVVEDLPGVGDLINEFDFNQTPLPALILPLYPNAPTASAGGPYTIAEGQSLTLDASQSTDGRGLPMTFAWDLKSDGIFGDGSGVGPTLSWDRLLSLGLTADGGPYQVAVKATDSAGWSTVSQFTTLTITPVAPKIWLTGPATNVEGELYTLDLTATLKGQPNGTTIDWGDGSSTDLTGPEPQSATHVYAAAGSYTISATASDHGTTYDAKNKIQLTVQDAPLSATALSPSAGVGVEFSGTVASFTDPGANGSLADYSAIITWGNGNTSAGTISANAAGGFDVAGSNTYMRVGTYSFSVLIQDSGGASIQVGGQMAVAILLLPNVLAPVVERSPFNGVLATFADPGGAAKDYSASITWGDGNQSAGTVKATGTGTFSVSGSNTYAEAGNYLISIALKKQSAAAATVQITFTVLDGNLQASAVSASATEGTAFDGVLADFQDQSGDGTTSDYSATITWPDGSSAAGTITPDGSGGFNVSAPHVFPEEGSYTAAVLIADRGGASASVAAPVTVQDAPLQPIGLTVKPTVGTAFGGQVAEFRDPGTDGTVDDYSATISWGDGAKSAGTIVHDAGGGDLYDIVGTNTYAAAGTYSVAVAVADSGGALVSVATSALVTDVGLVATSKSISVIEGKTFNRIVADFRDPNGRGRSSDYTATITWGDGSTSAGVVASTSSKTFTVTGSNHYAEEGSYPVVVTIVDVAASGDPTVTAYGQANVTDAQLTGVAQAVSPVEGAAFTGIVAKFRDADPSGSAADYTATIAWGDGHTSTGTVSADSKGGFDVSGSNTYEQAGTAAITVTINDGGGASVTVHSSAVVADASIAVTFVKFHGREESLYSGLVARFTDANSFAAPADFTATISWGDGTTSAGTISTDASAGFDVSGSHTYMTNGTYGVSITVNDLEGASASAHGTIAVWDPRLSPEPPPDKFGLLQALTIARPVEGVSFTGAVATFTDSGFNGSTSLYQVTIDWGDGTTSTGSIQQDPAGGDLLDVIGTHTYASTGSYFTHCTVLDPGPDSPPNQVTYFGAAQVLPAPLTTTPVPVTPEAGVQFTGTLATFTSANPNATASEYSANISWGDGQVSPATIQENPSSVFSITGTSTYAQTGTYQVTIVIDEQGYYLTQVQTTAVVGDVPSLASGGSTTTATSTVVVGAQDQRFVAQAYLDLLNRPVDPSGLATWTAALAQGESRAQVILRIEESPEHLRQVVEGLYGLLLHRTADRGGLSTWVSFLALGHSIEQAESLIVGSPEYFQNRAGGTNDGFLNAIYQDALQRSPDPTGRQSFDLQLAQGVARAQVAMEIFATEVYRQDLVRSYYLRRPVDSTGLAAFVGALDRGQTDQDVIAALVGSDEYFSRV